MNSKSTYKRVKINWWLYITLIVLYAGIFVRMFFAYIHQSGNIPVTVPAFFVMGSLLALVAVFCGFGAGRFIVKIDDFVTARTDMFLFMKIKVANIRTVNVEYLARPRFVGFWFQNKNLEIIILDFVKQVVSIKVKSGKIYQIVTKNAEKIKEEIEKRISTSNNIIIS